MSVAGALCAALYAVWGLGWIGEPDVARLAASAFFLTFFGGLLLLRRTRSAEFALGALATFVALAAGLEAYRWARPPAPRASAEVTNDAAIRAAIAAGDWRPREQVERALEAAGHRLNRAAKVFHILPWVDLGYTGDLLPIGGAAHRSRVHCNESGYWPVFRTDRFGFPNDDAAWDRGGRRVMLVGDSYAAGECVHQAESVASQLQELGFAAVTVGVSGNGPLVELASLREYGPLFRPQAVVWFHFDPHMINRIAIEDIGRGWGGEAYSAKLTRYLDSGFSQRLAARQPEIDAFWDMLWLSHESLRGRQSAEPDAAAKRRVALNHSRAALNLRALAPGETLSRAEAIELFLEILKRAKEDTETWGGRLYFAAYNDIARYRGAAQEDRGALLPRVAALGIHVIDLDAALRATGDPLAHFPFRGHPTPFSPNGQSHNNARGYRVYAEALARAIEPHR